MAMTALGLNMIVGKFKGMGRSTVLALTSPSGWWSVASA